MFYQVRNKATGQCLDSMARKQGEKVGMVSCHGQGGNQVTMEINIICFTGGFKGGLEGGSTGNKRNESHMLGLNV